LPKTEGNCNLSVHASPDHGESIFAKMKRILLIGRINPADFIAQEDKTL